MNMTRRALLGTIPLASFAVLAGCNMQATLAITLPAAQAQASAILTAFTTIEADVGPALPAATQTKISSGLTIAKDAVAVFTAIPTGGSYATEATNVISALTPLVSLIPMAADTAIAITEGLTLISALIKGLTSVPAPTTSAAMGAMPAARVIAAPIPIPLS
jgi:hypothetical protein